MELKAQKRDLKENLKVIKEKGKIPAVLYGKKIESKSVLVNAVEFEKIYKENGRSSIFTINIDGEKENVVIKSLDYHPVKDNIIHIDFYVPTQGQEMEAEVNFNFIGIPKAIKAGNMVNKNLLSITVKTLPKNLPNHIDINIENLENIGDSISLSDVKIPKGVNFSVDDLTETVVNVTTAKTAEEDENNNSEELEITEEKTE